VVKNTNQVMNLQLMKKKIKELLHLLAEKGIDQPYLLQVEKWAILNMDDIEELSNHFEWIVHRAQSKSEQQ